MLSLKSMPWDGHRKFSLLRSCCILCSSLLQLPASQRGSIHCCQPEMDWALSRVSEILFRSQESAAWKSIHAVSWRWKRNCGIAVPSSTNSNSDISKNNSVLGSAPFVIQGEILTLPEGNMAHPQSKAVWEPNPFLQAVERQSPTKVGHTCILLLSHNPVQGELCWHWVPLKDLPQVSQTEKFCSQQDIFCLFFCCSENCSRAWK